MNAAELSRFLVENSPDALSHHDLNGVFLWASPECLAVFGRAPEELLGRSLFELVAHGDAEPTRARWDEAIAAGRRGALRLPLRHTEEGAARWAEVRLRVAPRSAHAPESVEPTASVVCSSSDVTEDVERERALEARLERAELAERHRDYLVDMTPGMVWVAPISADRKRYHSTYMSPYLFNVTGYTREEWLGTPNMLWTIIHPDDEARIREATARKMADGTPVPAYRIRGKNGRILWLQSFSHVEHDAGGEPIRMYGLTLDVTIYKEAELERAEAAERMRVLKERLDILLSALPGVVWETWDPGQTSAARTGFASDHVRALTGYEPEEWTSGPDAWLKLVPDDDRERVREAVRGILEEGRGELTHRVRDKYGRHLWLENHLVVTRDEVGMPIGARGIALDITQRVLLRQENERQAKRLLELSAPLIPITDQILLLPLVGTVDPERAEHILRSLLQGVASTKSRIAIIDVTGAVGLDDAESSSTLVRAALTVKMLGARVVVTGIRPEMALALARLGVDLSALTVRSTLQRAIREFVGGARPPASKGLRPYAPDGRYP
jgi:rsbT co-antagonist protein RsbR